MNKNLSISKSIEIHSSADKVWDALINPEKIKVYLFGTEAISDWENGSSIIFQGEYEGRTYKDKGEVLACKKLETLKYTYWSGFSGLEDLPENYSEITYHIEKLSEGSVSFSWTQVGFANEEGQAHSENGLQGILQQIKDLVEKG